jgi:hypothetical protein
MPVPLRSARTIFSVESKHLQTLDAGAGVRLFRDLLWCEASRLGLPRHTVVISLNATVKDGGVDAKVEDAPRTDSLLINGDSYFQIKTGTTFKPWRLGELKKELFGRSTAKPSRHLLGEAVRQCLDRGARYVLVALGQDLLPLQHSQACAALKGLLAACGYKKPGAEVLGLGQVLAHLDRLPSLSLELNGRADSVFHTVAAWSARADMRVGLKIAHLQSQFIEQARTCVRGTEYQHLRVVGEPGIGKTRLVLEAISVEDVRPTVIYVASGEDLQRSPLFNELLKSDREYAVTVIVDDCEEKDRASIWNALKGQPRLKLVSIDHGPEGSSDSSMHVLQCPPLPKEQIAEIIAEYIGKRNDVTNWAEWCEGSPRVAHAVGDNLKRNPEDILKPPATVAIWDRFVLGHKVRESKDADQHLIVLRHLALFRRFGFEPPVDNEARFISSLVAEADPSITWAKFQSIVRHHAGRRILQGRHTLFIVPKALHVHLWLAFWDQHGRGVDIEGLLARMPSGLKSWFLQLFIYAHASSVAGQAVKRLLSPTNGPFARREFLASDLGAHFLNCLAEADAKSTVNLLEATLGRWPLEEVRAWHTGRQEIVWALEKVAVWKELFPKAARLLVHLALGENAKNSNNSEGTLAGLFMIGVGWAATEASPAERFPILEELVRSSDANRRALGLILCGQWLDTSGGFRVVGVEYQGLRPTKDFWRPKTYGELWDCWKRVWRFLRDELRSWAPSDRHLAASRLVDAAGGLLYQPALADEVLDTLFELAEDTAVERQMLVQFVIRVLRFRSVKLLKSVVSRLKALDKKLTGATFWDRFSRYVLYTNWDEDYSFKQKAITELESPKKRVKQLAGELIRSDRYMGEHLPRLVTREGHRLGQFGYELAKADKGCRRDEAILKAVVDAGPDAKSQFVGGYLAGVRELRPARWEEVLLGLLADASTRTIGVECVWRSGISERVVEALLTLSENDEVPPSAFGRLGLIAHNSGISKALIERIAWALIKRKDERWLQVCLDLVNDYFLRDGGSDLLPEDLTFKLLTAGDFFAKDSDTMLSHHWHRFAQRFRQLYPSRDLDLFPVIIENLHRSRAPRSMSHPSQIADAIAKTHPERAWRIVSRWLQSRHDNRYHVLNWLGGDPGFFDERVGRGAIQHFDPDDILSWVRARPKDRARLICKALPKTLDPADGGQLTQRFIEEFGDADEVAGSLVSHFWTGGWTGPKSEHLASKRDKARKWLSQISSPKVQAWLERYIERLSNDIETAQIDEERRF